MIAEVVLLSNGTVLFTSSENENKQQYCILMLLEVCFLSMNEIKWCAPYFFCFVSSVQLN